MRLARNAIFMKPIAASAIAMFLHAATPGVAAAEEGSTGPLVLTPDRREYTPGMKVPPEYRVVEGPRKKLLVSGAVVFGVSYLAMASLGIYGLATTTGDATGSVFMFIPVLPPFGYALAPTYNASSGSALLRTAFFVDGVMQVAGIGLLIAGAVTRGKYLERQNVVSVVPSVTVGPKSVGFQWSF